LGLPYPGGPNVQALATNGKAVVNLPSALVKNKTEMSFSYSGLKTAVINYCHTAEQRGEQVVREDVAASFQKAAIEPLVKKAVECAKKLNVPTITAGGGVAANSYLRESLTAECAKAKIKLVLPERKFCTDNAAMIAAEGLNQYLAGNFAPMDINARAAIPLKG
jgi:N6-L-threonylcarbamoyladenine synthase